MPESCCCGNELGGEQPFKVTHSPCKCDEPGAGKRAMVRPFGYHSMITEQTRNERVKLGLDIETPREKDARRREF